jgi:multiple sugar transport system permease protein
MAEVVTTLRQAPRVRRVAWLKSNLFRQRASRALATILAAIGAIIILVPVAWMISSSLKTRFTVLQLPVQWIPTNPQWRNYYDVLTFMPFGLFFRNTFIYAIGGALAEMLSCSLVAFGFARLRAPGRNALFLLVLGTMMLPFQATMIPQYVMFTRWLGWGDTWKPLMVPPFFGSAYLIFLLRQFYLTIHQDLVDAAHIDGCSHAGVWWRIAVPLSASAIAVVGILSFVYRWNDFLGPLIYLNSTAKLPVSVGLSRLTASYGGTPWHWLMAASLTAVAPLIVLFFMAQRHFIQGIVITGVKG